MNANICQSCGNITGSCLTRCRRCKSEDVIHFYSVHNPQYMAMKEYMMYKRKQANSASSSLAVTALIGVVSAVAFLVLHPAPIIQLIKHIC